MAELNLSELANEVKDNSIYVLGKKVMSLMGDIGAGAIAGAAAALVPTGSMKPWQKFCVGVGAYGIGRWVGQQASTAIETEMDENVEFICSVAGVIKNVSNAAAEAEEKEETDEEVEEVTEEE